MHKTLLLISPPEDDSFRDRLVKLNAFLGYHLKLYRGSEINTSSDVQLMAQRVGAEAVICTNPYVLDIVLNDQYDYNKPAGRKAITLDDYQGSILDLHPIPKANIPAREMLVLNPPEQLITVPYADFVFQRFISKITKKHTWFPQTRFKWCVLKPGENDHELHDTLQRFASADFLAPDIETAIGDPLRRINCVGYCAYFRASHTTECIVIPYDCWDSVTWVRKFNDLPVAKVFQNGLYDNSYFARWGSMPENWLWDTQHLFHSWYSELPKRLDFITAFSVRKVRFWKDDGSTGNLLDYYRYNAMDCWSTLNSFLALLSEMPKWAKDNYLIEFPKVFPCLTCGLEGIANDMDRLAPAKAKAEKQLAEDLERFRFKIAEPNFNPGSWQQVAKLFKVLGLNLPTTGKADMLKAKASSPFNEMILDHVTVYREKAKLISNYYDEDKLWNNRWYYSLNPAGTDTGRLASKESSFWCGVQIQNITRGESVKQCYISDPGWLFAEIDKAQSEARCVGYLSGEEKLINLVESDKDYHSFNASAFFGIPYDTIWFNGKCINKDIRDLSKRTNHGANYNMGANVMLDTMGPKNVSRAKSLLKLPLHMRLKDVCQFLLDRYANTYPKVKGLWYDSIVRRITTSRKLVSALGWTRYFFGNPSKNKRDLNAAVAHEPQNLSVAIINEEFYNVWWATIYGELRNRVRLKAQIHDSIFFQYRQEEPTLPHYIRDKYMNSRVKITGADGVTREMYIPSDISYGKPRWSELK